MDRTGILKLQAFMMVILMVTSGLLVMIHLQSGVEGEDIDEDTYFDGTWVIREDTTILEDVTVYVDDVNGLDNPPEMYPPRTGVVIGSRGIEGATLTVKGTLIIEEGSINIGESFPEPTFGELVVDGGTIRIQTNGMTTYSININANGIMEVMGGTIQNNGTTNGGGGSDSDTFNFFANSSLTIQDSLIEDLGESQVITTSPQFVGYSGGINIKFPSEGDVSEIFYHIENTTINNSKVGLAFENFPHNKGYFEGIDFSNVDTHLNVTGSAPVLINCSADDDWMIMIQDKIRENEMAPDTNASHPILVNCGDVDEDNVDIYSGTLDPAPDVVDSESTLNVSALVDIIVRDQAGNNISGAEVKVEDTLYDLALGKMMEGYPNHGRYITNQTVFNGYTNSSGIASSVAIPLYSIYAHTDWEMDPPPGSLDQIKYTRSHAEWNTTINYTVNNIPESARVNNNTGDPIDLDTGNIIVILNLKPNFNVRPIAIFDDIFPKPIAGNVIQFWGSVRNDGTMAAYANISFYNSTKDEDHLLDRFSPVFIEPGSPNAFRTELVRRINWTTYRSMGDAWYEIICVVEDLSGYEPLDKKRDNERNLSLFLERPTPEMSVDVRFDNDSPIDGDLVTVFANITNIGMAEAKRLTVSFWDGDPMNGGIQIGTNQTFNNLDVGEFRELNVTWDTLQKANDTIYTSTLGQTFVTHDIYAWVEYNNLEDPNPLKTNNNTGNLALDVNKFYNVDFQPDAQFNYINEEVPYTIYAYKVKNIGRAVDSFTFPVNTWSSNMSNLDDWTALLYTDDIPNLDGMDIALYPGESEIIYVNVSADWGEINQGELFVVFINATSQNGTARMMMVKASTSAGTVDYTPTEITFRREDGVRAQNQGTAPDSTLKSLVANETSTLTAQIKNEGTAGSVFAFNVTFYVDVFGSPIPIGSTTFSEYIPAGFFSVASIEYVFTSPGLKKIYVQVDSLEEIGELSEDNNWFDTTIYVKNESAAFDFTISGIIFDWDGQTPLSGATIRLRNNVTGYIDTTGSDSKGKYTLVIPKEFYSDNDAIYLRATHPPDPAEDSTTLRFYSEDLAVTNVDLYLFVFGVDLTFQPRLDYEISFVREDGKYTNQPIMGEDTIIRFWVVNRGTVGTNATYQITKNGTSTVNIIGDPADTFDWYGPQSITIVDYTHVFTDPEIVDFDINIVDDNALETYTVNNLARRTGVTIKSRLTNAPYNVTGTVYERASGSENVFAADANVTITNTRTGYSYTTTTDDFGRFAYNLRNLPDGYEEGDFINVRAWKGEKEGIKEFYAYSEDRGIDLVIVFATYDVRLQVSGTNPSAVPGGFAIYVITILNTGNVNDKFTLGLEGSHASWGTLLDEENNTVDRVTLNAGMADSVNLVVDIPSDYSVAFFPQDAHIIVVATSNDGNGPSFRIDTYTAVEQVHSFEIELDTTTGNALPGESVSYTITLTNTGNGQDTILLSLTGDGSSWGEFTESTVIIPRDGIKQITLTVSIPDNTPAGDNAVFQIVAFTAGGHFSTTTAFITTTVDEFFGVDLFVGSSTQFGDPGTTVTYTITVINTGNSQQQINFNIAGDSLGTISSNPILGAFKRTVVTLDVDIPRQAKAFEVYKNLVSAYLAAHAQVTSNTIAINTVVNEVFGKPDLLVTSSNESNIRPEQSVTFTLRITNNANADDTFTFLVNNSNPDFTHDIPAITIQSNSSGVVEMKVRAPRNTVFGESAVFEVQAVSSKGLKSGTMIGGPISVTVLDHIYGVELSMAGSEYTKWINLGQSVSYTITVKNTGDYANFGNLIALEITNLNPAVADWVIDVESPVQMTPGEEFRDVVIFVRVPSTTATDDDISFNVKATVILPKLVEGWENDPMYTSEIAGIETIVNQKPYVKILHPDGPSLPHYYYRELLEFDADVDDDETPVEDLAFQWNFGDGTPGSIIQNPTHRFDLPGTYQVSLTVTDEFGETDTAIYPVKVGNNKPQVKSIDTESGGTTFKKGEVWFVVDPYDEDIESLDYTWYFGDGTVTTIFKEKTINHNYTRTGTFLVTCIAFDEYGGFGSNSMSIIIQNRPPVPSFMIIFDGKKYSWNDNEKITVTEGDEVFFDATGSTDPDSDHGDKIISFDWNFGDNTTGSGVQPSHIYKDSFEGGYEISLTVTDSEGLQVTEKGALLIIVEEDDQGPPIEVLMMIALLTAFLIFLIFMFVRSPKRFKGAAQAEMSELIAKLNDLENKLRMGGAAVIGSFGPRPQKFCNNCGEGNEPDGKFCESCGTPLG